MKKADINIAQSRGDAVIALLQRARIAPLPVFYGLLYDYVAGVQSLDASRAGHLVDAAVPDATAGETLYDEFVRPYEANETFERVVDQLVQRLTTLDALIVQRREASRSQSAALSAASDRLHSASLDPALLRDWVRRLTSTNEAAREANARLTREVGAAREELASTQDELARLARDSLVDPLTLIANRKGLDAALAKSISAARDSGGCMSVAVVDIDNFKHFNDVYGHQVGDAVLKLATRALLANVREGDVVGRLGGDEFVVVLADCSQERVMGRAEAIRSAVLGSDLAPLLGADILGGITVSIGVSTFREGDSIPTLLERADHRLLAAKAAGRNRVVGEDGTEPPRLAAAG